jgi:GT2 family glycosyltransferase
MSRKVIISIVSHGHQSLIRETGLLAGIRDFHIVLRENLPGAKQLICNAEVATFVQNLRVAGFGANHNRNFELAAPGDDDWFVICNPDISADGSLIERLLDLAEKDRASIAAPKLWNNTTNSFDDNVRPFPTFVSLMLSFAGVAGPSRYSEDTLDDLVHPDWASGAFVAFKAAMFRQLQGFDERYFMYMEDVDICKRARDLVHMVRFYPGIKLIHNAARQNRSISSRNFRYHVISAIKYFLWKDWCR